MEREREGNDKEKWVHDSSVDYRGRVPIRNSTGVWIASFFIMVLEFSERVCYFGLATNLVSYLTKALHQDVKTAARNVNFWVGVTTMMPLFGGFLADAYTGRFLMVLISSIIYILSLGLLTLSQFVPTLRSCKESCQKGTSVHQVIFFIALYLISMGTGGQKPSLESFGADQFDDDHPEERKKKMTFFNYWTFNHSCGCLIGTTAIVYVQEYVSWGLANLILASVMAISFVVFALGRPFYRYRAAQGSPFRPMLQVLVAAITKRNLSCPNPSELYEVSSTQQRGSRLLCHTRRQRFLDKAAIIESQADKEMQSIDKINPWKLATVTQVEELKLLVSVFPIWLSSLMCGVFIAQSGTLFVKQASTMNLKLTPRFKIPEASMATAGSLAMMATIYIYDRFLMPVLRRVTGTERGISILQRIGIGMSINTLSMAVAALVEQKRLIVAGSDSVNGATTMSVFWLGPQYMILGIGDGFFIVGLQEFYYDQVPDTMRTVGIALFLSVIGVSNFLSGFLITIVDHLTAKDGKGGWFNKDLNKSHLDYFFWFLTVLGVANTFVYAYVARRYVYKNVDRSEGS